MPTSPGNLKSEVS